MQKRSEKKVMGCSIDAAAKKTRARTTYQLKVLVLQRAHWQPPQPVAREFHDCDSDPMPVHEIQLQRDPPVHREVRPQGGLRARALRLPVRRSWYLIHIFLHSCFDILFTFFFIHVLRRLYLSHSSFRWSFIGHWLFSLVEATDALVIRLLDASLYLLSCWQINLLSSNIY